MTPTATLSDGEALAAVLGASDDLFFRRGVAAVSMAEVRDASGVSLRRLYSLFPAKTDLVTCWLTHRHTVWMRSFEAEFRAHVAAGIQPVDAVFDAIADWLVSTEFRGCGFINTWAETGERTAQHEAVIRDHKAALRTLLATIADDGSEGCALAVIVDGAIVQAAIFESTDPIDAARRAAHALTSGGS